MDKVLISNAQGESGIVNVVRYFQNNGKEYIIYSLNEVDESGYTRLYVTKLSGMGGSYTGELLDDNEWNEVKNLVKVIVKANKEGMPVPVQDLNPKNINNIMLKDKKVFKLNAPLVNDLGNNKPNFGDEPVQDVGGMQSSVQSPIGAPIQPTFDMPSASPVQPSFDAPIQSPIDAPSFTNPVDPVNNFGNSFNSQSAFDAPVQPTFDMPSASPVQPSFDMLSSSPVQPTFDVPTRANVDTNNNSYSVPNNPFDVQSSFGTTSTPVESTNSFETSFNTQPSFDVSSQPSFDTPVQPTFDMSGQQSYGMPSVGAPAFDSSSVSSFGGQVSDYKSMYDEEVSKNGALQDEVNRLNDELSKYKSIVDNIKNVIEK